MPNAMSTMLATRPPYLKNLLMTPPCCGLTEVDAAYSLRTSPRPSGRSTRSEREPCGAVLRENPQTGPRRATSRPASHPGARPLSGGRSVGGEACRCDQPGDHRVRVPPLAGAELVAAPHRRRDRRHQVEHALRHRRFLTEPAGSLDGLAEVRDRSAAPAAELVAEQAQPPRDAGAHRAGGDHPAARLARVGRRRQLDREAIATEVDDQGRVIEVASRAALARRDEGLVDLAVEPDAMPARAERDPVEVDGGGVWRLHGHTLAHAHARAIRGRRAASTRNVRSTRGERR